MKSKLFLIIGLSAIFIVFMVNILKTDSATRGNTTLLSFPMAQRNLASVAVAVKSPFTYNFSVNGRLSETGNMNDSTSPYWWLNSGAYMYLRDGYGMTIQGELPQKDKWRQAYNLANPSDTDSGYHPQNIFRMITRSKWQNFSQQFTFKIAKHTLSQSSERQGYSGVLFFIRYIDSDNLYYAGVRDDGDVVIKRKKNGNYVTLAEKKYFQGVYDREKNASLLPLGTFISMKSSIITNPDNSVTIKLYLDETNTENWKEVLSVVDRNNTILGEGYAGIRVDFKDVIFDNYKNVNITSL